MVLNKIKECIDVETGEITSVDDRDVKVRKRKFKAEWYMGDINGSGVLAKLNLSKNEYRVILMLQSKLNYNNRIFVNKSLLAKEFGCDKSMIYKSIALLEKRDILLKIGAFYKFNNTFVRCGGVKHEE